MVGKRSSKRSSPVASSHRWSTPWSSMRRGHGPADHVAGRQLVDEALAVGVAEQRAVAAQRLGQQRAGHGRVVQRGRVELHELDVGHRHAGPQRHGDAVAGGLGRVGGDREELAGAAGGQQRRGRPAPRAPRPSASRAAHPDAAPALDEQVEGEPRSRARAAAVRRTASTRARSTSAPVAAPPACTTRAGEWPPSRASARRRRARRGRTPRPSAISSLTRPGPSSTSTRTASASHRPAPAASVSARCRSVESSSPPSTAATPPWAQRVVDWASSPLVSTPDPQAVPASASADRGRQPGHAAAEDQQVERSPGRGPGASRRAPASARDGSASQRGRRAAPRSRSTTALAASTWTTAGSKPSSSASLVVGVGDDDHLVAAAAPGGRRRR